jgi:hypothetical protein
VCNRLSTSARDVSRRRTVSSLHLRNCRISDVPSAPAPWRTFQVSRTAVVLTLLRHQHFASCAEHERNDAHLMMDYGSVASCLQPRCHHHHVPPLVKGEAARRLRDEV